MQAVDNINQGDRHSGIFIYHDMFIVLDMLMILKKMFMTFDWISLGCFLAVRTLQRATTTVTRDIVVITCHSCRTLADGGRVVTTCTLSLQTAGKMYDPIPCLPKKYKKNFIWNYIIFFVLTNANKAWSEYDIYQDICLFVFVPLVNFSLIWRCHR